MPDMQGLSSYIVIPSGREKDCCCGGVIALDKPDAQGMAVCSSNLQLHAGARLLARWRADKVRADCMEMQQYLERWLREASAQDCRMDQIIWRYEELKRRSVPWRQRSAAAALVSEMSQDSMTLTPLAMGEGAVWLLTPGNGLTVIAQDSFAYQRVAALPCIVFLTSQKPPGEDELTQLRLEKRLLTALEEADTPEDCRCALLRDFSRDGGALRLMSFWGWEDFEAVKASFRPRLRSVSDLMEIMESLDSHAVPALMAQYGMDTRKKGE